MTDGLKEKAVDVFKPVIRQTCLKVTLTKNQMDAGISLTVQGCVWHLPCSLCIFPSAVVFFNVVFIKSSLGLLFWMNVPSDVQHSSFSTHLKKKTSVTNRVVYLLFTKSSFFFFSRLSFLQLSVCMGCLCVISWMWQVQRVTAEILSSTLLLGLLVST